MGMRLEHPRQRQRSTQVRLNSGIDNKPADMRSPRSVAYALSQILANALALLPGQAFKCPARGTIAAAVVRRARGRVDVETAAQGLCSACVGGG
jgi:hypothetical protein